MAPAILLPNPTTYKGYLRGNVDDDVRLLRFDVTRRSDLTLSLEADSNAPFDLKLLTDRGRYVQCNCGSTGEETIRRQISPGRYFVVVQAEKFWSASFTLSLKVRLITHVNVRFDNTAYGKIAPPGGSPGSPRTSRLRLAGRPRSNASTRIVVNPLSLRP